MLTDPDLTALILLVALIHPESADIKDEALPSRRPEVSITLIVAASHPPCWFAIAVSDTHALRSHALLPVRLETLNALIARFSPCTVTLAEPVDAAFTMIEELKLANPVDSVAEVVPAREPTVCDILKLRTAPTPA